MNKKFVSVLQTMLFNTLLKDLQFLLYIDDNLFYYVLFSYYNYEI